MSSEEVRIVGPLTEDQRKHLAMALRLAKAVESIRCAFRCYSRLPGIDAPVNISDRWQLIFAHLGATGEAIKLIDEAVSRRRLSQAFALEDPEMRRHWEYLTRRPAEPLVKLAKRVRDKYWAHWDDCVALSFISKLEKSPKMPPFMESTGDGIVEDTCYTWPRYSMVSDVLDSAGVTTHGDSKSLIDEVIAFGGRTSGLLEHAILHLLDVSGVQYGVHIVDKHDS